ncbi:hypothetical protein BV25DRAFT_1913839 [Artomyces pyxidatus]|uniref:Uncharacterized protein n=1 Tax=Artomyces pyxidatus TaxID=48021 RepID=A0ACB8TA92_9AGAM|nr:hypothetical protein BV25DRAFT_1913839 [Artomyces pyxidatus]
MASSLCIPLIYLPLLFCLFGSRVAAQSPAFLWSFKGNTTVLPECQSVALSVQSTTVEPPFYMIAYEVDGTTTVSSVDTDGNNLSWQVNHRAGSELLLNLVDSAGHSGVVSPATWAVEDGDSASCVPTLPTTFPVLTANVTKDLSTCQPLGLVMSGGSPPYTISIASPGATVLNLTLSAQDDMFTYINKAVPSSDLLVTASDSAGRWAVQSVLINTVGSADTQCPSLASTSGSSTSQTDPFANATTSHHVALVVGICVGVAFTIIFGGLLFLWCFLRQRSKQIRAGQDAGGRSWGGSTLVATQLSKMEVVKNNPSRSVDLTEAFTSDFVSPSKPSRAGKRLAKTASSYGVLDISPESVHAGKKSSESDSPYGVLDISPANRPVSPTFAPNPEIHRYVPSPSPSMPRRQIPLRSPIEPYVPSSSSSSSLRLTTDVQPYYSSFHATPTSPQIHARPLPTPPVTPSPQTPHPQKICDVEIESPRSRRASRHLRSARSAGDVRRVGPLGHRPPGLTSQQHQSLSRSRSLMHIRPNDVVVQHHDRSPIRIHDIPPPYHECLSSRVSQPSP